MVCTWTSHVTDLPLGTMERSPVRSTRGSLSGLEGTLVTLNASMCFARHKHTSVRRTIKRLCPYLKDTRFSSGRKGTTESGDLNPVLNYRELSELQSPYW